MAGGGKYALRTLLLWFAVASASLAQRVVPDQSAGPRTGAERLHRGALLIANRDLQDPNFSRSVVLVTQFDDSGTVGLILNRPLPVPAAQALPPLAGATPDPGGLFLGGPVGVETLQLLARTDADLGPESKLVDEVHLILGAGILKQLVDGRIRATALRLFAGYAGWAPGQLESELLRGDWILWTADPETIFAAAPERLWLELVDRAGEQWVRAPPGGADAGAAAQYNLRFSDGTGLRHRPAGEMTAHSCSVRSGIQPEYDRESSACGRGQLLTC